MPETARIQSFVPIPGPVMATGFGGARFLTVVDKTLLNSI